MCGYRYLRYCDCVGVWIQVRASLSVCGCVDTGTCVTVSVCVCVGGGVQVRASLCGCGCG